MTLHLLNVRWTPEEFMEFTEYLPYTNMKKIKLCYSYVQFFQLRLQKCVVQSDKECVGPAVCA